MLMMRSVPLLNITHNPQECLLTRMRECEVYCVGHCECRFALVFTHITCHEGRLSKSSFCGFRGGERGQMVGSQNTCCLDGLSKLSGVRDASRTPRQKRSFDAHWFAEPTWLKAPASASRRTVHLIIAFPAIDLNKQFISALYIKYLMTSHKFAFMSNCSKQNWNIRKEKACAMFGWEPCMVHCSNNENYNSCMAI